MHDFPRASAFSCTARASVSALPGPALPRHPREGRHEQNFNPAVNDIKTLYYQKFRGGGGKGDAELDNVNDD